MMILPSAGSVSRGKAFCAHANRNTERTTVPRDSEPLRIIDRQEFDGCLGNQQKLITVSTGRRQGMRILRILGRGRGYPTHYNDGRAVQAAHDSP